MVLLRFLELRPRSFPPPSELHPNTRQFPASQRGPSAYTAMANQPHMQVTADSATIGPTKSYCTAGTQICTVILSGLT
jgi:hypothetical protein